MAPQQVCVVVGKEDDLAGLDLDRLAIGNPCNQTPFGHIVVEHEMLGAFEERAAILRGNLRKNAPRSRELGMQEHAALQAHDPQHVRERVHVSASCP
jgi:hypothetical protein